MMPLFTLLLIELIRVGGTAKDKDLYENLKKIVSAMNGEISYSTFNKTLMVLEIRGYVRVESIRRGTRMVYLIKKPSEEVSESPKA